MNELVYLRAETGALRTADGHLVVPVVALIGDAILHAVNSNAPEFVPASVLSSHIAEWAGKSVVNNHPTRNGRQYSANDPAIQASHAFGTIENARVVGGKLLMDCRLDPTKAEHVGAGPLLARLRAGQMSEISVGCFVTTTDTPGTHGGKPYVRRWASLIPDHIAAVSRGACSCDQGCGFLRAASADEFLPPDPYAPGLKKMRGENYLELTPDLDPRHKANPMTPPDGYAIALNYARAVAGETPPAKTPLDAGGVPDIYAAGIRKLQEENR